MEDNDITKAFTKVRAAELVTEMVMIEDDCGLGSEDSVICIKVGATFDSQIDLHPNDALRSEAINCFPDSIEPIYQAILVLFDTTQNVYTLATCDWQTGRLVWTTVRGSSRGWRLCDRINEGR